MGIPRPVRPPLPALRPERRLIAASFASALEDARNGGPCTGNEAGYASQRSVNGVKAKRQQQAIAWLESDEDGPLTAVWYTDILGINLKALRAKLAGGTLRKLARGEIR